MLRGLCFIVASLMTLLVVSDAFAVSSASVAFASSCGISASSFVNRFDAAGTTQQRVGKTAISMAHHPIPKGAKKYEKNRPRKHGLADINRKAPAYAVDTMALARQKIPEYTVMGQADMSKYTKVTKADGSVFYHTKAPFSRQG